MAEYHISGPLTEEAIRNLRIGDSVTLSGKGFTCRSKLQRYIFDEGHTLPFPTTERNILIHSGPIVVWENNMWRLVSFMPTSSIRFEKWGAKSIDAWGLRMIVGKTTMGADTTAMMKKNGCVHVSPQSVSPQLWIDSIKIEDVHLFDELGTIEAAWQVEFSSLGPFIVDIDTEGNNLFDRIDQKVAANRKRALERLGVAEDFEYTKLY